MTEVQHFEAPHISLSELDKVLDRARVEQWREIALLGHDTYDGYEQGLRNRGQPTQHIFRLVDFSDDIVGKVIALTDLTSLDLIGNSIDDDGARALASLTGLTSLHLGDNDIGDDGARALSSLTQLTSLDLWKNRIGADGARALSSLSRLTSLNLGGNDIGTDGARALISLTGLTQLLLWDNKIGIEGARALASLTGLTYLNLLRSEIGTDGARALVSLTDLSWLYLEGNNIGDDGARALASLTALTSLDLSSNGIGNEGTRAVASLTGLTLLDLSSNGIDEDGARALSSLSGLTSLNLGENDIRDEGARALSSLTSLTSLNLSSNNIGDDGARALSALTGLTSLDLSSNNIGDDGTRALLDAWIESTNPSTLTRLDLRKNGDLSMVLPPEVLEASDAQAIFAAYRRYRVAAEYDTLHPLEEAKLLVVGNEAVGKTSLIRYLVENQPRDPDEQKTPGTTIHEKIETRTWSQDESGVTLNVWDFGGQEIMHGTHRFFLTERSLYLLVLEARREDDRSIYDWLKTIRNRGGDSPVIVVINKCDDDTKDLRLDETGLRRDYPAIVGFVRTSCDATDHGAASIARLRTLIAETLSDDQRLKHVRDPIPQPWLRVKDDVTALARERRVLENRSFIELCEHPEGEDIGEDDVIGDADEQRVLLRLLHDLGVVVAHGIGDDAGAARREITLLDPNWLTGAIYTLLNNRGIADQGGEFSRDDMKRLLDPSPYPAAWHEFILDMMQDPDIGLCFDLPGTQRERYLIPEALPANEPDYEIWPESSLWFRYTYDSLPSGLVPRFIVQAHRNLTDHPTRWRTGVVLGAAGCRILVRGDRDRQRIDIMVDGPENRRRLALNIVLNDLDEVHHLNPEVEPRALVPLADQPDLDVSYEHLLTLEERHGLDHVFDPEDADRAYTVRELLEGVRRNPVRPDEFDGGHVRGRGSRRTRYPAPLPNEPSTGIEQPTDYNQPHIATKASVFSDWRFFSVACGLGAVAIAIIMVYLLSNESRVIFGWLVGLGVLVTGFMMRMNPAFFYRRLLSYVIPAGLLANAIGFSADLFVSSDPAMGGIRWDGSVSDWFFAAWAVVVGFLVTGDVLLQKR